MTKRVLLLGLRPDLVESFRRSLDVPGVEVATGSTLSDLEAAFAAGVVDHVVLGGGLDIETRSTAVGLVFQLSDRATVHLKDQMSGPEGFVPFATALLRGLADYSPVPSTNAVLRATDPE